VAIPTALKRGLAAVQSLDVLVRNVLGADREAMAAWKRVRHVEFVVHPSSPANGSRPAAMEDARENVAVSSQGAMQEGAPEAATLEDALQKAS
jgi:hypothetical protein